MRYIRPQYYDSFRCLAGSCPDTCCAGWQIMIDDAALERYSGLEGPMGGRLAGSIDWQEGAFRQSGGRCLLLNRENLCDLVLEQGEEALCETCARYPRHVEEFADQRELSLSLSCPEAARIILSQQEPLTFLVEETDEPDPLDEEFEAFDFLLFTQLEDARGAFISMLQDRTCPMDARMDKMMYFAEKMQACLEEDKLYEMDGVIGSLAGGGTFQTEEAPEFSCGPRERFQRLKAGYSVFFSLERLREEWTDILQRAWDTLYAGSYENYRNIRQCFQEEFAGTSQSGPRWEIWKENLLLFFLYTYFCGAVYDEWIYSKAALAVFSVSYLEEFIMSEWFLADKNISWEKCDELAYRYAREIEHSDENLNLLEEWLQQNRRKGKVSGR